MISEPSAELPARQHRAGPDAFRAPLGPRSPSAGGLLSLNLAGHSEGRPFVGLAICTARRVTLWADRAPFCGRRGQARGPIKTIISAVKLFAPSGRPAEGAEWMERPARCQPNGIDTKEAIKCSESRAVSQRSGEQAHVYFAIPIGGRPAGWLAGPLERRSTRIESSLRASSTERRRE